MNELPVPFNGCRDHFDQLLGSVYDAVTAPAGFQPFIERFVQTFELKAALMFTTNAADQQVKGLWAYGIESTWLQRYSNGIGAEDMLAQHLAQSPISNFYATNLDLNPDFVDSRFFKEWVAPQEVAFAAAAIILMEGPWLSQVTLQRRRGQPPFSRQELHRLNQLIPHLQRAVQMRQRFTELSLGQNMLTSGLDMLTMPTILVDEFGRAVFANRSARTILDQRRCLRNDGGHLSTPERQLTQQLNLQINTAVRASRGESIRSPTSVLIPRPGQRPLMLLISPFKLSEGAQVKGAALIFVHDADSPRTATASTIGQLFQLTQAESELALALCGGLSLEESAAARNTSLHTVRAQLKSLFIKTGTNRQADLVGLLLCSPAFIVDHQESPAMAIGRAIGAS